MLIRVKKIKFIFTIVLIGTVVFFFNGCTTLHTAAAKGNMNALDRLVSEGNDMDAVNDLGQTPLIQAINVNQKGSLEFLLKSGANVNAADTIFGNTPLHHAIMQGNSKFVALLLSYNADITIQNYDKKTPFDVSQEKNNEEISRLMGTANATVVEVKKEKIEISENNSEAPKKVSDEQSVTPLSPVVAAAEIAQKPPVQIDFPKNALQTINGMISRRETRGIRNYLDKYPQSISLITDPKQQLRYIGPSGWRVIDIIEKMKSERMQEKTIVEYINSNGLLYKKFNEEEIKMLLQYGFSYKMINAMMQAC